MAYLSNEVLLTLKKLNIPVSFLSYTGKADTYIVFNFEDERGGNYGDDTPSIELVSMQVHLFAPQSSNVNELKNKIKTILFNEGWSYPQTTSFYENETKRNHFIFTTEKEHKIIWQKLD